MAQVDIAAETLKVGNALASVRIDQMILNLAKGIAWGQYDLDKVGVDITKMMGVPGTVSIGGEKISMLEAGFIPSFYHFVDTILELKMEVNIREEQSTSLSAKQSFSGSTSTEIGAEVGMKYKAKAGFGLFSASAEVSAKASWKNKTTSAYSRSVDASHSQKFSQDLSASSLMRTKLVPVPPPEVLVERIKILLEKLRKEAEDDDAAQILFTLVASEELIDALNTNNVDPVKTAFSGSEKAIDLVEPTIKVITEGTRWTISDTSGAYFIEKDGDQLKVYKGSPENKKSLEEILLGKVEEKLLERLE